MNSDCKLLNFIADQTQSLHKCISTFIISHLSLALTSRGSKRQKIFRILILDNKYPNSIFLQFDCKIKTAILKCNSIN